MLPFKGGIEGFAVCSRESIAASHRPSVDLDREGRVFEPALLGDVDRIVAAGKAKRSVGAAQGVRRHSLADRGNADLLKLGVCFLDLPT